MTCNNKSKGASLSICTCARIYAENVYICRACPCQLMYFISFYRNRRHSEWTATRIRCKSKIFSTVDLTKGKTSPWTTTSQRRASHGVPMLGISTVLTMPSTCDMWFSLPYNGPGISSGHHGGVTPPPGRLPILGWLCGRVLVTNYRLGWILNRWGRNPHGDMQHHLCCLWELTGGSRWMPGPLTGTRRWAVCDGTCWGKIGHSTTWLVMDIPFLYNQGLVMDRHRYTALALWGGALQAWDVLHDELITLH